MRLKYDFMNIFMHHLSLYFVIESLRPLRGYQKLNSMANTDIRGQIRILEGKYGLSANTQH